MSPMLRQGSRSKHVQRLQAALAGKGFNPGPVDGEFGPTTERAVREFQRAEGLGVDGIVGPMTWEALLGPAPAASGHRLSDRGVDFIARFEGFRGTLYNDPAGHCTIGYGHLLHRGRCNGSEPAEFRNGISRQRAAQLLRADAAVAAVRDNGAVALTQTQFDALVSFSFNAGAGRSAGPPCCSGSTPGPTRRSPSSSNAGSPPAAGPYPVRSPGVRPKPSCSPPAATSSGMKGA